MFGYCFETALELTLALSLNIKSDLTIIISSKMRSVGYVRITQIQAFIFKNTLSLHPDGFHSSKIPAHPAHFLPVHALGTLAPSSPSCLASASWRMCVHHHSFPALLSERPTHAVPVPEGKRSDFPPASKSPAAPSLHCGLSRCWLSARAVR